MWRRLATEPYEFIISGAAGWGHEREEGDLLGRRHYGHRRSVLNTFQGHTMSYVPIIVTTREPPSHRARELADRLSRVIVDFEQHHPTVSNAAVRQATRLALQASRRGAMSRPRSRRPWFFSSSSWSASACSLSYEVAD